MKPCGNKAEEQPVSPFGFYERELNYTLEGNNQRFNLCWVIGNSGKCGECSWKNTFGCFVTSTWIFLPKVYFLQFLFLHSMFQKYFFKYLFKYS